MPGKTTTDKQYGLYMQAGKSRKSQQVALDLWAYAHKVILEFSRPGKPTDNAMQRNSILPLRAIQYCRFWG